MEATTTTDETTSALPSAVTELLDPTSDKPVAIIRRQDDDVAMVLTGAVGSAELLADIPLEGGDVLALIPFHQIRERGWEALAGEEALLYLQVTSRWEVPLEALLGAIPSSPPPT